MKHYISRLLLALLVVFLMLGSLSRPVKVSADTQSDFIQKLSPTVVKVAKQYNLYASLMLAQAALESGFGQSQLSLQANNYFGVKGNYNGQSITMPTTEYDSKGSKYTNNAQFKKYPDAQSSLNDYAQLLRNGLIGNANFYSGSWKENAQSVTDAANSLVGKYATDPTYATKLLNVISTYNLTSLDRGITVESNQIANNNNPASNQATTSSQSSQINKDTDTGQTTTSSSSSTLNNTSNTNQTTDSSSVPTNIKYTKGAKNQIVNLAADYQNNGLYTAIPGTTNDDNKAKAWNNRTINTNQVVVDMMGKDTNTQQIWYRIHATNSSDNYWVKASSLSFNTFYYNQFSGQIKSNQLSSKSAYNHILSTPQIAVKLKAADPAKSGSYEVNMIATDRNGSTNNWVRYKTSNNKQAWVQLNGIQASQTFKTNLVKSIRTNYKRFRLYNNLPINGANATSTSWSELKLATIDKVTIKAAAVRFSDRSLWYQVNLANHKYWLSAKALN